MIDSFQQIISKEKGLYIVCSDKGLLDKINKMLKRQGVIGVTDGEGRLHYMIDARKSPGHAARQVNEFVHNMMDNVIIGQDSFVTDEVATQILDEVITSVFGFYSLDITLMGSRILRAIVTYCVYNGIRQQYSMKDLYIRVGWEMHLTYNQIERNVRYALNKSQFAGMRIKTINIIEVLLEAVKLGLSSNKLEVVEGKKDKKSEKNKKRST